MILLLEYRRTTKVDRKTRRIKKIHRIYYPKDDIHWLCLEREISRRSLLQIYATRKEVEISIEEYLNKIYKENQLLKIIISHENN